MKTSKRIRFVCAAVLLVTSCTSQDSVAPLGLADRLPKSLDIQETFRDVPGTDGFFLLKAVYTSQNDIDEICRDFRLKPYQGEDPEGMAKIVAKRMSVEWFPLSNVTNVFYFRSFTADGKWKKNVKGRYEHRLWVDERNKLLVFQEAGM